jgi:hypothetical protein
MYTNGFVIEWTAQIHNGRRSVECPLGYAKRSHRRNLHESWTVKFAGRSVQQAHNHPHLLPLVERVPRTTMIFSYANIDTPTAPFARAAMALPFGRRS